MRHKKLQKHTTLAMLGGTRLRRGVAGTTAAVAAMAALTASQAPSLLQTEPVNHTNAGAQEKSSAALLFASALRVALESYVAVKENHEETQVGGDQQGTLGARDARVAERDREQGDAETDHDRNLEGEHRGFGG